MAGVRVLDFTRVIAGPVCTRFLAALGADVLRLDPPGHPDMATGAVADTLLGKRSAFLDLAADDSLATLETLLAGPTWSSAATDRVPSIASASAHESLVERHPGIVAVYLDAWGHTGRGLAGAASTASSRPRPASPPANRPPATEPGALPCQLLDHGTGYLAAAAALDGRPPSARRRRDPRPTALAGPHGLWLTSQGTRSPRAADCGRRPVPEPAAVARRHSTAHGGPVTAVAPPGAFGGHPLRWPSPVTGYGTHRARGPPPPSHQRA